MIVTMLSGSERKKKLQRINTQMVMGRQQHCCGVNALGVDGCCWWRCISAVDASLQSTTLGIETLPRSIR